MPMSLQVLTIWLLCVSPQAAPSAENQTWDLRDFVNADLTTYARGTAYPARGGFLHIAGIPFFLTPDPDGQHTSIVQIFSGVLGNTVRRPLPLNGSPPRVDSETTIPIERVGVASVYVLLNSAFGSCGAVVGELEFTGNAQTYHYRLREGINIRDHNNGAFCNTLTTAAGVANYGNVRLDMQEIRLPEAFDQHLDSLTIRGFRQHPQSGLPFLAAVTLKIDRSEPATSITTRITFAAANDCLPGVHTPLCTPSHATVDPTGPNEFHIVLPANLRDAADIPNPQNRPISILGVQGTVCWQVERPYPEGCDNSPNARGVIDASHPAGALIAHNLHGRTYFSINGLTRDLIPNGPRAQKFDGYEGSLEFKVRVE